MKVTFILPAIGKKRGKSYIKTWQRMEPLTISTLCGLTPESVETEFFDDRSELIDYATETDLVAITVETYTARRAYLIAAKFRAHGIPVILGGYHVTLCPEEAARHADAVVIGNAENIWSQVIQDLQKGRLQKTYQGSPQFSCNVPDRSIFRGKNYSRVAVIETGRGCTFTCAFCTITSFYNGTYYCKPVDQIVEEIHLAKKDGKNIFFFADDNIVADSQYAIKLFKAIAPLNIRWTGQGSLTMATNPELLHWMEKSGCAVILIGYESLVVENLKQMQKGWSTRLGAMGDLTEKIHAAGLNIYATFLFGFDHDTSDLVDRTIQFTKKHGFFFAAFNHLVPMPGTRLHTQLQQEDKIIWPKWWTDPQYRYGALIFKPKCLSPEQLSMLCKKARKNFYSLVSILKRSLRLLKRNRSLLLFCYFWQLNLLLGKEVEEKSGLPMGDNLDALPK
jgi:radical SAM superfamily enzyme YgiQ (UPF0313 family)